MQYFNISFLFYCASCISYNKNMLSILLSANKNHLNFQHWFERLRHNLLRKHDKKNFSLIIKLAMKLAPSAMKLIQSTLLLISVCHFFFLFTNRNFVFILLVVILCAMLLPGPKKEPINRRGLRIIVAKLVITKLKKS